MMVFTFRALAGLLMLCCATTCFAQITSTDSATTRDDTYGTGGKKIEKTILNADGSTIKEETYYDPRGIKRYHKTLERFTNQNRREEEVYTDCKGRINYSKQSLFTSAGHRLFFQEVVYRNGVIHTGIRRETDATGKYRVFRYNKNTSGWVETDPGYNDGTLPGGIFTPDYNCEPPDEVFAGFSIMNEDGTKRYFSFGLNASYTYSITTDFGVMADAGIWFGSTNGIKNKRVQFLAGLSYFPGNEDKQLSFAPHLLIGLVNRKSDYGITKISTTSFGFALGVDGGYKLTGKYGIKARLDYTPFFPRGGSLHNFRFSAGGFMRLN